MPEENLDNKILKKLEKYLIKSRDQQSSHWKNYLENSDFNNIEKSFGFGIFEKKSMLHTPIHLFFQKLIFGMRIFYTDEYKLFKKLCDLQNRQLDVDVMKHIFTFNFLNRYNAIKNNICVIGDGKANFVGGLLAMNSKDIKIFSINLTEVLIHDYLMIRKTNLIDDESIIVVENEKDLEHPNKKLYLIDASKNYLLKNKNINLFVNIASMQEMKKETVKDYFQIIKSNSSYFYCCNRTYKKLIGGEELIFNQYPWGKPKKIVWENCQWYKKSYLFKYPYIFKMDGVVKHALLKYL